MSKLAMILVACLGDSDAGVCAVQALPVYGAPSFSECLEYALERNVRMYAAAGVNPTLSMGYCVPVEQAREDADYRVKTLRDSGYIITHVKVEI